MSALAPITPFEVSHSAVRGFDPNQCATEPICAPARCNRAVAKPTSEVATSRGSAGMGSIASKVPPGIPASASTPATRSSAAASSSAMLTPSDHPTTRYRSHPASSTTAKASATWSAISMPPCGTSEGGMPRCHQVRASKPQSGSCKEGHAAGLEARPLQMRSGIPAASLRHAASTVPSGLRTGYWVTGTVCTAAAVRRDSCR